MYVNSEPASIFAIVCSILSAVSSGLVVLSGLMFPTMLRKVFMRIIMIIALCDMIGCIALSIGYPAAGSDLCVFQGVVSIFFIRASFLWTLCFSYQLYCLVKYNKLKLYEYQMHLICWSASAVFELLPLSTTTYGADDSLSENIWCYLKYYDGAGTLWVLLAFTIPLVLSILMMSLFCIRLQCHYRQDFLLPNERIKSAVDVLKLYPLAMIFCWLPNAITSTIINISDVDLSSVAQSLIIVSLGLGSLYGCMLSIIFFTNSKETRERWFHLMYGYRSDTAAIFIDFSEIESYEHELRESEHAIFHDLQKRFQRTVSRTFSISSTTGTDSQAHNFSNSDLFGMRPKSLDI